jgi:hypothetical protein
LTALSVLSRLAIKETTKANPAIIYRYILTSLLGKVVESSHIDELRVLSTHAPGYRGVEPIIA